MFDIKKQLMWSKLKVGLVVTLALFVLAATARSVIAAGHHPWARWPEFPALAEGTGSFACPHSTAITESPWNGGSPVRHSKRTQPSA